MEPLISESTLIKSLKVESLKIESSKGHAVLPLDTLKELNTRSTTQGLFRLVTHLVILGSSGYIWGTNMGQNWAIALPALVIYGKFLQTHQCRRHHIRRNLVA